MHKYLKSYNLLHNSISIPLTDGSNQFMSLLSQGSRTLDIACGQGHLLKLNPQIIGLDFSMTALQQISNSFSKTISPNPYPLTPGLINADAHHLPFKAQSFDLAICSGSLEHFASPIIALREMARISSFQFITVHRPFPLPFSRTLRYLLLSLLHEPDQPLDRPLNLSELHKLITQAGLTPIYSGAWHLPYTWGLLPFRIPQLIKSLPSCHFLITHLTQPTGMLNSFQHPRKFPADPETRFAARRASSG